MNTYKFEANGKKIEVEAAKMLEAMAEANKQFGSLPQGAWMAGGSLDALGFEIREKGQ
jgi:hypothetical protein